MNNLRGNIEMANAATQARSILHHDRDLVSPFASPWDNCESGLLQRYAGSGVPDLSRSDLTTTDCLITGLETRFADLAMPENVRIGRDSEGDQV